MKKDDDKTDEQFLRSHNRSGYSSMVMKFENFNLMQFACYFFFYLLVVIVSLVITSYGPSVTKNSVQTKNVNPKSYEWIIEREISNLERLNQPISSSIQLENTKDLIVSANVFLTVKVYGLPKDSKGVVKPKLLSNSTHKRKIFCKAKAKCVPIRLMEEPFLRYDSYRVNVLMKRNFTTNFFTKITINWKIRNTKITIFETFFRYSYLMASLIIILITTRSCKDIPSGLFSTEQKWIAYLLPCLVLYNNPFSTLSLFIPSPANDIFQALVSLLFLHLLVLFVLCLIDNHRVPLLQRKWYKFYLPKILLLTISFLSIFIVYTKERLKREEDMLYTSISDFSGIKHIGVLLILIVIILIIWLFAGSIITYIKLKKIQTQMKKFKFFVAINFFTFIIFAILFFIRVGGRKNNTTGIYLSTYTVFNFYIYFLVLAYLPSKQFKSKIHKIIQNSSKGDTLDQQVIDNLNFDGIEKKNKSNLNNDFDMEEIENDQNNDFFLSEKND
ncbi:transmembrane protein [Anaeramoeba flamelloides]|uniref:Transmembrane protein n=1 Tax=Anaeramoeba flamelloides TaxID=1746091 RepID=A0ABQ8ZFD7_9EUKA|nr:transmembrane protein [Anaeramoeba flamelloides]